MQLPKQRTQKLSSFLPLSKNHDILGLHIKVVQRHGPDEPHKVVMPRILQLSPCTMLLASWGASSFVISTISPAWGARADVVSQVRQVRQVRMRKLACGVREDRANTGGWGGNHRICIFRPPPPHASSVSAWPWKRSLFSIRPPAPCASLPRRRLCPRPSVVERPPALASRYGRSPVCGCGTHERASRCAAP